MQDVFSKVFGVYRDCKGVEHFVGGPSFLDAYDFLPIGRHNAELNPNNLSLEQIAEIINATLNI